MKIVALAASIFLQQQALQAIQMRKILATLSASLLAVMPRFVTTLVSLTD